jgi:hypothetical protein
MASRETRAMPREECWRREEIANNFPGVRFPDAAMRFPSLAAFFSAQDLSISSTVSR